MTKYLGECNGQKVSCLELIIMDIDEGYLLDDIDEENGDCELILDDNFIRT